MSLTFTLCLTMERSFESISYSLIIILDFLKKLYFVIKIFKISLKDSIDELKNINKLIVITRSENGSVAILNNEITNCESIKVDKVLDLTGAGDLFAAGFLKEYLDKSNIKKCLQTGSKLAAKIILKIGARLN